MYSDFLNTFRAPFTEWNAKASAANNTRPAAATSSRSKSDPPTRSLASTHQHTRTCTPTVATPPHARCVTHRLTHAYTQKMNGNSDSDEESAGMAYFLPIGIADDSPPKRRCVCVRACIVLLRIDAPRCSR